MTAPLSPAALLRPLAAYGAFGAIYFGFAGLYGAYLPLYLKDAGFAAFAIAALVTVNNITRCVGPYAWGWLGDHTGKRLAIVRGSCIAAVLLSAGLFAPPLFTVFYAVLLTLNLSTSSMTPLTESMLIARLTRDSAGNNGSKIVDWGAYGRLRLWGSAGFVIAIVLAGWLFEHFSIEWFGLCCVVLLTLLMFASFALPPDTAGLHNQAAPPRVLPMLRQPVIAAFYVSCFFMVASHMGMYVFYSLYLDSLGYGKTTIGLLWSVGVIFEIGWFYFQGRAIKRISLPVLWVLACAAAAVRFVLIGAFGSSIVVLIAAGALHMLTFAAHHTASMSFITRHFAGASSNRGMALFTAIAYGFGGLAGGLASGKVAQHWAHLGYGTVFYLGAMLAVLATGAALYVYKHDNAWRNASGHAHGSDSPQDPDSRVPV
jgi:PPP family 3-phenylpropionic acid transporter